MSKRKTFTFHTHHFSAMTTGQPERKERPNIFHPIFTVCYKAGLFAIWLVRCTARSIFHACFMVGSGLLKAVQKIASAGEKEVEKTIHFFAQRLKLFKSIAFRQSMGMFLFICLLGWGIFASAKLVATALELKDAVVKFALSGNQHLSQAEEALQAQNFAQADSEFESALRNFNATSNEIDSAGNLLNGLLNALPQKRGADKLVEAGQLISESGKQMLEVKARMSNFKFSPEGMNSTADFAADMDFISKTLEKATENLNRTIVLFSEVDSDILPKEQQIPFVTAMGKVEALRTSVKSLSGIFSMLTKFSVGKKNVLILFQNNNELRATGGFLGTYGSFVLHDGKIENLNISSIYDLDGQLTEKIVPPTPLLNVNTRWYMRDSNWFASWPESAREISGFYEKEGGETPDLVLALTPQLISEWLKITGPIQMKNFGVTFDSENFVERMQILTSVEKDGPLNNPKQAMADFFPVLLQKLSELPEDRYGLVAQSLLKSLVSKHILLFSRDASLQQQFEKYDWAGAVLTNDRDSLLVVSSNLGGTKTDLFIEQKTELTTKIEEDGTVVNELTITRKNRMPKIEGAKNTSFLRILVPRGSELLNNEGFDFKNLDTSELKNYKVDSDVYQWEKNSLRDVVSGTTIGQEAGKTYFGNWISLEGGETKTVKLTYKLPTQLDKLDHYSMLLQKQPGTQNQQFTQTVLFPGRRLEWKNFTESSLKADSVSVSLPLERDILLGSIFSLR